MADVVDEEGRSIRFAMVDITNLTDPTAGHVDEIRLHVKDRNHVTVRFEYVGKGKISQWLVDLARIPAQ